MRAVEVTTSNVGDAPMLPELLNQVPPDQNIGSVTADGAYDSRKCHDAIAARGTHAVIPPRKNAKPWKPTSAGAIARNEAVNASLYLGRALWRRCVLELGKGSPWRLKQSRSVLLIFFNIIFIMRYYT